MRLSALIVATLSLTAGTCLAQDTAPVSVTRVAFGLSAGTGQGPLPGSFPTEGQDRVPFEMGQPEGSGFQAPLVTATKPRATVRLSAERSKKAFGVPWQTGIFQ